MDILLSTNTIITFVCTFGCTPECVHTVCKCLPSLHRAEASFANECSAVSRVDGPLLFLSGCLHRCRGSPFLRVLSAQLPPSQESSTVQVANFIHPPAGLLETGPGNILSPHPCRPHPKPPALARERVPAMSLFVTLSSRFVREVARKSTGPDESMSVRLERHQAQIGTHISPWRLSTLKRAVMNEARSSFDRGSIAAALDGFAHALAIEEQLRWRDYSFTAAAEYNIGVCLHLTWDFDDAQVKRGGLSARAVAVAAAVSGGHGDAVVWSKRRGARGGAHSDARSCARAAVLVPARPAALSVASRRRVCAVRSRAAACLSERCGGARGCAGVVRPLPGHPRLQRAALLRPRPDRRAELCASAPSQGADRRDPPGPPAAQGVAGRAPGRRRRLPDALLAPRFAAAGARGPAWRRRRCAGDGRSARPAGAAVGSHRGVRRGANGQAV